MPATRQDKADVIDQYIYDREQLLQKKVSSLSITLFNRVFNEYLQVLEQSNGKLVYNNKNISAVQGLEAVYNAFNKKDNIPVVKSFLNDATGLTGLNEDYFKVVSDRPISGVSKIARQETYKKLGVTQNGNLVPNGFAEKFIKDKTLLKDIKRITVQAIVQKKGFLQLKNDLEKQIKGVPGKPLSGGLQQYYRNYAYDTIMFVDRRNAETFANGLGLKYFYWSGGIIQTSRALCRLCNGKIFDVNDLKHLTYETLKPSLRGGISPDWIPVIHLGYHGCRHRKNYVSDQEAVKHRAKWMDVNSLATKRVVPEG